MPIESVISFSLEVPDLAAGVRFYSDAGLEPDLSGETARFRCRGEPQAAINLHGGVAKKKLHHVTLRASDLAQLERDIPAAGGKIVSPPKGGGTVEGLWIVDPHGVLMHLVESAPPQDLPERPPFGVNVAGAVVRKGRPAILRKSAYDAVAPLRLGHILLFSPDVMTSVAFVTEGLGMSLADHCGDVIAFCCARKNSEHHVLAFAKSDGVGFHHASFAVSDPDAVGRGGRALVEKSSGGDWGFGRHTIGSNFFHYIQDPWGSWIEYYSDMDFVEDAELWKPNNYQPEDALASWGPAVPPDFVHNYEIGASFSDERM